MKKYLLAIISISILGAGCYENVDNTPEPEVIIETAEVYIETRLSGSVTDVSDEFISDYYLNINEEIHDVASDYFLIKIEDARKKGQTIHVVKDGNHIGLKTELLVENDINHLTIDTHGPFLNVVEPNTGGIVQLRKELTVDLTSFETKELYSEDYKFEFIDIEEDINLTTVAYNNESHLLAIDSRGGFYLTVNTVNGDRLEIDPSNPAILNIGELEDNSNALFVFDEKVEIWKFVSDISSNVEIPILAEGYYTIARYSKGVFAEGIVTKEDKQVSYQPMEFTYDGIHNQFCSTEKGNWIALLPEQNDIDINLLNPCDESLQSEVITIANDDVDGQVLVVTNSDNYQYLNSTIIDCDGNIVEESSINVTSSNSANHYVFSESDQNRWIAVCDEYDVAAYNLENQSIGTQVNWSANINEEISLLSDCEEYADGFSYFQIRDDEKVYGSFTVEVQNDRTILRSKEGEISIAFKGTGAGVFDEKQVNIRIDDESFGEKGYYISCENSVEGCGIEQFEVSRFDEEIDGQLRVTFSGELWMQTLNPMVAGTFHIEGVIITKV